jgi:hypothetical protein
MKVAAGIIMVMFWILAATKWPILGALLHGFGG